jgi:ubiquinone biosynthesis protein
MDYTKLGPMMLIRLINLGAVIAYELAVLALQTVCSRVASKRTMNGARIGECLRRICERTGGAFPKIGQILSTRPDLLPPAICAELAILQDRVSAPSHSRILEVLRREYRSVPFESFDQIPVASATVAQVYRAVRADNHRDIAVKVMLPDVLRKIKSDCRIAEFFGPAIACLPAMKSVPLREALAQASVLLQRQTNFRQEAANLVRLGDIFRGCNRILVPRIHGDLCTENIVCMDFVGGMRKLTDPSIPDDEAKELIVVGLQGLYKMIFDAGFVHCDLHPGNVLAAPDGRLVILDAGLVTELDDYTRRSFAEFFAAIALRNGYKAAEIVRETAIRLPKHLDCLSFDRDIAELINRVGGLSAREFEVAGFIAELFDIQNKYGIYGTPRFTLIILALLVYEGVAKQRCPDLDFQKEAIPFVMPVLLRGIPKVTLGSSPSAADVPRN